MANILVQHIEVVESKLNLVPVIDGQLILVSDKGDWYYDKENERIPVADIIPLKTEAERAGLIAPLSKLYFVKSTVKLYYYFGEWIELSGLNGKDGMAGIVISNEKPTGNTLPVWIDPSDTGVSLSLMDVVRMVVDEAIDNGTLVGSAGVVISETEPTGENRPVWLKPESDTK